MRKVFTIALCAVGFILIAAPIYMNKDVHQLTINGNSIGTAQFVNGQWVMPIEDFSRAVGGSLTLEPYLKLNGNHLTAVASSYDWVKASTPAQKPDASNSANTIGGTQLKQTTALPADQAKFHSNAIIAVRKAGEISSHVFSANGKTWVPVADVARALGGTFTASASVQPGQTFTLNFAPSPTSILGYQSGGHGH
jgi:hypothetical protein